VLRARPGARRGGNRLAGLVVVAATITLVGCRVATTRSSEATAVSAFPPSPYTLLTVSGGRTTSVSAAIARRDSVSAA
jgi:hypothetical protein